MGNDDKAKYQLPSVRWLLQSLLLAGKEEHAIAVCLTEMVAALARNTRPDELQFSIYDGQEPIFHFSPVPGRHRAIHTSAAAAIQELEWANAEMDRRYAQLAQARCRKLDGYNLTHGDAPLPQIAIVIHELGDLMAADAARTERLLGKLLARSRAVGIHVLCSTTRIRKDVLSAAILSGFWARLVFRVDSLSESRLLGVDPSPLPKWARRYCGNPATSIGQDVSKAEKCRNAARLEADEAILRFFCSYLVFDDRQTEVKQERRLIWINSREKSGKMP